MLKKVFAHVLMVAAPMLAAMPAMSAPEGIYIDSSTPQVIENIDGNIVTFKDSSGKSNVYYVPSWMFQKYDLKVGTEATLFNKNVIQGIYKSSTYIEVADPGIPTQPAVFAVHDTRKYCTKAESPASVGLWSGKRVWYKGECCLATIPIVGSMSFYKKREIAVESVSRPELPPPTPYVAPEPRPRTW